MATKETGNAAVGWSEFRQAEAQFAERVEARFKKYKHHVLATLRKDGSPG